LEKEKPPVFGMIQRGGQVVLNLLANVQQKTIEPLIKGTIDPGTLIYTDEYSIYARLQTWGYDHKQVRSIYRAL
jgi:transposase-like protein